MSFICFMLAVNATIGAVIGAIYSAENYPMTRDEARFALMWFIGGGVGVAVVGLVRFGAHAIVAAELLPKRKPKLPKAKVHP